MKISSFDESIYSYVNDICKTKDSLYYIILNVYISISSENTTFKTIHSLSYRNEHFITSFSSHDLAHLIPFLQQDRKI